MSIIKNIFKTAKREVLQSRFVVTLAQAAGSSYILSQRLWLSLAVGGAATTLRYALPYILRRSFEPIKTPISMSSATNLGATYIATGAALLLYPDPQTVNMIQAIDHFLREAPIIGSGESRSLMRITGPYVLTATLAVTEALAATTVGELSALYLQTRKARRNHDPH